MLATAKVLPSALASRRHPTSTARAAESNCCSPAASATACTWGCDARACASMRAQAGASSWVNWPGSTSIASALLAAGVVLVALREPRDQAVDALGIDLLGELAAVGLDQPHAQDVQVVDLPAGAFARRLLEPVVQLDRVT